MNSNHPSHLAMQCTQDMLLVSMPSEIDMALHQEITQNILYNLKDNRCKGLVLDCSALMYLDNEEFCALLQIISMAKLMGVIGCFLCLQPSVVNALAHLEAPLHLAVGFYNLEDAIQHLQQNSI